MSELRFYEVNLTGRAGAGSRIVRKLALPFFSRLTTILESIVARLDHLDGRMAELAENSPGPIEAPAGGKLNQLNNKLDAINDKFDKLNFKFDRLNNKFDEINAGFKALIERQDGLEEKVVLVTSLHWDHVAVSRRLAQLEDRLIDAVEELSCDSDSERSILFPGFDLVEKEKAG